MTTFGPFRLDEEVGRAWYREAELALRAKSFSVLRELVRRRGRLATRSELLRACWPDTTVSPNVLRTCIGEIRAALGDDALRPRVLETVGRRGYRLRSDAGEAASDGPHDVLVGRKRQLAALRRTFARADAGLRQVVFVTGEPGLGKTTLLDHFVEELRATSRARVAVGQCMELIGGSEAYLPILDLLGRLCAEERDTLDAFDRWAPSWLLQMPGLLEPARAEALRKRVPSPSRDRMLRELGETVEALAADRPLVLVLEDLHWSDPSTVDALAYVAQRSRPARLLLAGSFRAVDLALRAHPLKTVKQGLQARGRCDEVALELLSRADTETWVARQLAGDPLAPGLAGEIHARTDGHPLFLTSLLPDLREQGVLALLDGCWRLIAPLAGIVPDSARALARRQIEHLAPEQRRILEAGSIGGAEFAAGTAAAAAGVALVDAEAICAELAERGQMVLATGVASWPDGTVSGRYAFRHSLYREVLDGTIAPLLRAQLHRRSGERIEAAYAASASAEVAPVLAFHFASAGDDARAMRYHLEAASGAKRRFADREVIAHLEAALRHLHEQPDTPERAQTELASLLDLGGAYFAAHGLASGDAMAAHRRALELADQLGLPQARIQAHGALYTFHVMRAELGRALEVARELLAATERVPFPFFTFLGHVSVGGALFNLGELAGARRHLEQADAVWHPGMPALPLDPTVICRTLLGFTSLLAGRPDEGAAWIARSSAHAAEAGSPYNLSYATEVAAQYFATAGERDAARANADAAAALAAEHEFPIHAAVATMMRGWADRDAARIRDGFAAYAASGQLLATSLFRALLVEVLLEDGDADAALAELEHAFGFVERTGERRHLAELHRLHGLALLARDDPARAEEALRRALEVARTQYAQLWTERSARALAGLLTDTGRSAEARALRAELRIA